MGCELSFKLVVVILLLILIIYNWRDGILNFLGPKSDAAPIYVTREHLKEVPQYVGYGRPPGSGGGPLSMSQKQSGGFAGITEKIMLEASGHWVKSAEGGFTDQGYLPAELARKVLANAEKAEPSANAGNCMDCYRYEVAMTYPSTQVVRKVLDKSVFPSSLFD